MGSTTVSAGGRAAGGSTRRRQGRQVPQEAALSGSFPPVAGSRTGSADGPRRPGQLWGADCELEQKNSFLRRCLTPHPLPQPLHLIPPSQPLGCRQYDCRQDRGGKGRKEPPAQPNCGKKKKKRKEIPSPETNSLNRHGKPTPEQAKLQLQPRLRRAGGVPGLEHRGGRGSGSPRAPERLPEGTKLPPTIPAGSSRVSQRRRCASRRLPSPGSLLLRARLLPFAPSRTRQPEKILGRKKCERSHDSFLSAAARAARLAPSLSRSRARRASRAPRFLLSSPCERPQ